VQALRDFRRDDMLRNAVERGSHNLYQELSPPVAEVIREHESLRTLTRWSRTPIACSVSRPKTALGLLLGMCALA